MDLCDFIDGNGTVTTVLSKAKFEHFNCKLALKFDHVEIQMNVIATDKSIVLDGFLGTQQCIKNFNEISTMHKLIL